MKKYLVVLLALMIALVAMASVASAVDVPEGKVVSRGDVTSITTINGHAVKQNPRIIEPKCEEEGLAEFDCEEGGVAHIHNVRIAPLGHAWASEGNDPEWGHVIEAPTCQKPGKAQDYCTREKCGITREVYREIAKNQHEYDDKVLVEPYYKAPTCVTTGLGQHKCVFCGEPKVETEAEMVVLPVVPHKWLDWNVTVQSTCEDYGVAYRACEWCNIQQILDKDHKIEDYLDKVPGVAKKNPNWADKTATFTEQKEYEAAVKSWKFEYEIKKNWLKDCYTREITYTCPYCHGSYHKDFVITLGYDKANQKGITLAHIWNAEPDEKLSKAPTCLEDGYDVFLCKYDATGIAHGHPDKVDLKTKDDRVKVVKVPALGHDWSAAKVIRTYTKDGKRYNELVSYCQRKGCGATKEDLVEVGTEPVTDLKKGEDGKTRYYEDGKFVEKTGIVLYQGGEFWVVKGVLASDANGLTICPDGEAYFLVQGQIQRVSQFAEYKGNWFIIKDGMLDESANGLYDYDGGKFVFAAGKLRNDVNGLWQNPKDNKWYFLANGQVQDVSQVASYNGEFFVVKNGVLDTDYNGTIEYDGKTFRVVKGQLYDEVA